MKYLLITLMAFGLAWGVMKATHYEERMERYNKYMCANYALEADCKTPLPEDERLQPYEQTIN